MKALAAVNVEPTVSHRRIRAALVLTGMALFVAGFLMLLVAVTPADQASPQRYADTAEVETSDGASSATLVLIGLLVSAAGLLVATLGPAMSFLSWSRTGR